MRIRISLILVLLVISCSCGRPITRISIPIQVESELDAATYSSFAVLPFVHKIIEPGETEDNPEIGEEIAAMMRRSVGRHENYDVVGSQETTRFLTGETVDADILNDTATLGQLGSYFDVDAIIAGSYEYYTISQPKTYYGEHYSRTQQQYVMDYQNYFQKMFILALRVMIVDTNTEKIVWDEKYERTAVEHHTLGSFLVSQVAPLNSIVRSLTKQAVAEFTRRIAPHYKTEVRFLVR